MFGLFFRAEVDGMTSGDRGEDDSHGKNQIQPISYHEYPGVRNKDMKRTTLVLHKLKK